MQDTFITDQLSPTEDITLADKISSLPVSPGIYQFKNKTGKIIYVGKAKNLRNRVRSYFQKGRPADAKTKALVNKIADIEVIIVDSEAEALILEDTLIKKLKPRYNVMLKDDKSYPYVRVTNETYPRIFTTRRLVRDGSKYFGPFTEVKPLKQMMKLLRSLFFFRSCDLKITPDAVARKKFRVCLDYHIHKCEGPCEGLISEKDYNDKVRQAFQILNGRTSELEKLLEAEMNHLAGQMRFEEAGAARDKLQMLKEYTSRQKIVSIDLVDRDVFGLARLEENACSLVFKVREGKLLSKRHYIINNAHELEDEEIIRRTIENFYLESDFIPKEIYLPAEPDDFDYILDWLNRLAGRSLDINIPKIGDKKKLVSLANANAEYILREYEIALAKREQSISHGVLSLQRDLRLPNPPLRIECIDNSHIQGSDYVSSLVVFENGKPKKSDYRKFKIKTFDGNDDFAAMQEVVGRHFTRLIEEKSQFPDLLIVDGGKGQLSSAFEIMRKLEIDNKVPVISLAKRLEEVFLPGISEPLLLPRTSSSLRLLQQLRDEAHRFAITFHRQLRDKRTLQTELTNIPGVGEKTAQKLLIKFGSFENIKNLEFEELSKVSGKAGAKKIMDYINKNNNLANNNNADEHD